MFGIKLSVDECNLLYLLIFKSFAENVVNIRSIIEWVKVTISISSNKYQVTQREKIEDINSYDRCHWRNPTKNREKN